MPASSGRPRPDVADQPEQLRGYAWLTICPQELGDRLGGVQALRPSGAFAQVEALGNGGHWLLATADRRDFGQPAAERMLPALVPGRADLCG